MTPEELSHKLAELGKSLHLECAVSPRRQRSISKEYSAQNHPMTNLGKKLSKEQAQP